MIQDMAFFDEPANTTNALSNVLSNSTDDLAGMGGPVMGGIFTFILTILGGIILSLVVCWKLALLCTATIPIVVACGWLRLQILNAFDTKVRQSGIDSAAYAGELIGSVRTVASLGLEEYSMRQYDSILAQRSAKSLQSILSASSLYAASQSVVYLCAALVFWYGGQLIADREYSTFQVYVCFVSLISGSQIAGSIFTFAPDASKAMHASQELDKVMQAKPKINHAFGNAEAETEKHDIQAQHPKGCRIEFEDVTFSYPSRPDRLALNNFSIIVEPGQTLALIGQTGSGKSTCVSLLERFYEPDLGRVLVDRHDITELDVNAYRQTISLVSQESIMFSGTIRENIAVGQVEREVSDPEIMEACRQASIINFVQSLPEGLSTLVGTSGNMLSGGQKQRIAIARAFLRKPKILLLDEATSALDTESEAIVQAAMDTIRRGRTTIMVAHRLSTIRNADVICVMKNGMLIESGSHHELMSLRGKYWEMVGMQNLH
ncbi:leptomycin B resistance protein pmd1 [Aureobasidium pullulans]|uniref:Leptomycin B resistance protein pmd1 n=1 Tax=Aureobasidium pullulans TaxID=5580 RepID=A0A4S9PI13_AURPU|nr:leptomycin B resistance protein pmd1 [Aureobasidium pullulans]THZ42336.1 leptomycin B resistance protein pmd1 [Aureobasidium pullulans]THZ73387.1 leptomycin B resistance protein pmd1 [Aureobasidium pullulans]